LLRGIPIVSAGYTAGRTKREVQAGALPLNKNDSVLLVANTTSLPTTTGVSKVEQPVEAETQEPFIKLDDSFYKEHNDNDNENELDDAEEVDEEEEEGQGNISSTEPALLELEPDLNWFDNSTLVTFDGETGGDYNTNTTYTESSSMCATVQCSLLTGLGIMIGIAILVALVYTIWRRHRSRRDSYSYCAKNHGGKSKS